MLKVSWFPELLPEEKIIEEKIFNIIKKSYQQLWYTPIETPAVEKNEVLLSKWWNEVSKQIFWLYWLAQWCDDKKNYSLHFDLTVPFARYVVDYKNNLTFPFKRSQIQKVRRWERAQKWRFREFYQADIDVIWETNQESNLFYDAEIIFLLSTTIEKIFKELNLPHSFTIKINNKKIIAWFIKELWLENKIQSITTIIDKKDKITTEEFIKLLEKEELTNSQVDEILYFINWKEDIKNKYQNEELNSWIEELNAVIDFLQNLWITNYQVDFSIVRWLDYYTWTVFETFIDDNRQLGSIASWGRYENFTKFIDSKTNFSWVGWSIWISRLESFIFEKIKINQKTTSEYLFINFPETEKEILKLYLKFIKEWKKAEVYPYNAKLKKQFKYADKKWIKYCIILWEDELKKWVYIQKNMVDGSEEKVKLV